jgi:hypothetical protein
MDNKGCERKKEFLEDFLKTGSPEAFVKYKQQEKNNNKKANKKT